MPLSIPFFAYSTFPPGDSMNLIQEQVLALAAASVTFAGIPGAYRHLVLLWTANGDDVAAQNIYCQFNGDVGGNYDWQILAGVGGGTAAASNSADTRIEVGRIQPSGINHFSSGMIEFIYYSQTTSEKVVNSTNFISGSTGIGVRLFGGDWTVSGSAITQILLAPDAGNFVANSRFSLYGIS